MIEEAIGQPERCVHSIGIRNIEITITLIATKDAIRQNIAVSGAINNSKATGHRILNDVRESENRRIRTATIENCITSVVKQREITAIETPTAVQPINGNSARCAHIIRRSIKHVVRYIEVIEEGNNVPPEIDPCVIDPT
jgi:hypothetical protein